MMLEQSLDGLLVISLEQAVAAPICSARLADAGARVIKIERPGGDFARGYDRVAKGQSSYFVWLNRGKESIVMDIKEERDREILAAMIAKADIFIQNLAPGAAARAGFDSRELREQHSKLITCDISGYGEEGPYAKMKAYDLLVQAESGLAAVTGRPEGPGRVGVSVCDIACGLYAHAGILQCLLARERATAPLPAEARGIQVSLFDSLADWMTVPLLHADYGGKAPERAGLHHPSIAPYGVYATGDGKETVFSIQNDREWQRLCSQVLKRPDMIQDTRFHDNPARVTNRQALDQAIDDVFAQLNREELVERLREAAIAYGAVNSPTDLIDHPQLRRWPLATPEGNIDLVAPPVRQEGQKRAYRPLPTLDQHGDSLRKEFGS